MSVACGFLVREFGIRVSLKENGDQSHGRCQESCCKEVDQGQARRQEGDEEEVVLLPWFP
jgi:hypothetical protein